MKPKLAALITSALEQLVSQGTLADMPHAPPQIDQPKDPAHGDLSCNVAMVMAKRAGIAPRDLAQQVIAALPDNSLIARTDIAGPGFINFFINPERHTEIIPTILSEKSNFGRADIGRGRRVQVEFVSANPTGPLHVGHGRGAAIGDSLGRLLEATGWTVQREFYYNDAGQQIHNLALSVQARAMGKDPEDPEWPEDGYQGTYIQDVANAFMARETVQAADREITASGDITDLGALGATAGQVFRHIQPADGHRFSIQVQQGEFEQRPGLGAIGVTDESRAENQHARARWMRVQVPADDVNLRRVAERPLLGRTDPVELRHDRIELRYRMKLRSEGPRQVGSGDQEHHEESAFPPAGRWLGRGMVDIRWAERCAQIGRAAQYWWAVSGTRGWGHVLQRWPFIEQLLERVEFFTAAPATYPAARLGQQRRVDHVGGVALRASGVHGGSAGSGLPDGRQAHHRTHQEPVSLTGSEGSIAPGAPPSRRNR